MARMGDIYAETLRDIKDAEHVAAGWFGRREDPYAASQTPAALPVNVRATAPQEDQVSLSTIAADIKNAIGNADDWVKQVTETHLPAILAVAAKLENDPIVQALERVSLPANVSAGIVMLLGELEAKYPAAAAVPAEQAEQPPAAA